MYAIYPPPLAPPLTIIHRLPTASYDTLLVATRGNVLVSIAGEVLGHESNQQAGPESGRNAEKHVPESEYVTMSVFRSVNWLVVALSAGFNTWLRNRALQAIEAYMNKRMALTL